MGFTRLLKVSTAFGLAKDRPHRYRAAEPGGLPRFEPVDRTPMEAAAANAEAARRASEAAGRAPAATTKNDSERTTAMNMPAARSTTARPAKFWAGLRAFLSLKWVARRRVSGAVRAGGRTAPGPVQQELSLGLVKPVRNDLSEADWEVVPPKKSATQRRFLRESASAGNSAAGKSPAPEREAALAGKI